MPKARPPSLYVILDQQTAISRGHTLVEVAQAACAAGASFFQLRAPGLTLAELYPIASQVARVCTAYRATLLINDRIDLAQALGCRGAHLPSTGLPTRVARSLLDSDAWLGRSCHSLDEAKAAERDGASFVTLSPIYETASKPGYGPALGPQALAYASPQLSIPIFALAGITPERVASCRLAGAYGVAIMSGICGAKDPYKATSDHLEALG